MTQEKDGSVISFMGPTEAFHLGGVFNPLLGFLLVASLFLPWIQGSQQLWGTLSSVSGFEFNPTLSKVGFFGGSLVIIASLIREKWIRCSVFLGVGALALVLFLVVCFSSPVLKEQGLFDTIDHVLGFGALLYGFAALGLMIGGLSELRE